MEQVPFCVSSPENILEDKRQKVKLGIVSIPKAEGWPSTELQLLRKIKDRIL